MQTVFAPVFSLFYLYAPEDQGFCVELEKHLSTLKQAGWIRTWHRSAIEPGRPWQQEINTYLATADIILLLVSADFLASEQSHEHELRYALQRHANHEVLVIPVLVRPVDWSLAPFGQLQPLPTNGVAITNWPSADQAFVTIAQDLKKIIEQRRTGQPHASEHVQEPLWTVPYRQNRFFTGREPLLEELARYFSSWHKVNTPVAALSGLGGIGKTQTALEYAYRNSPRYEAVFWLNASSEKTLIADSIALAESLDLPLLAGQEEAHVWSLLKRWLSGHARWLLIFDAVTDFSLIQNVLPLRSSGHVLLTTRAPVSKVHATTLELEILPEQEALELLLRRSGRLHDEQPLEQLPSATIQQARQLCLALGNLPLALDQAGAYIEETGCDVSEYARRYQQQQVVLLSLRGDTPVHHPDSVVTTLSLAFSYLEPRDARAADLLRACAFLAPEVIPQQIFLHGAAHLGPHLEGLLADEMRFDAALKSLRQFAFVQRFPQAQTISLHRLVQVVIRSQMQPEEQALWASRVVKALCAAFPQRQERDWAHCSLYIPHIAVCETLLEEYQLHIPEAGGLFYSVGRFFHEHAQYVQAKAFYERVLRIHEDGADGAGLAEILDSLGWLALDQGHYAEARPLFERARVLKEQVYGSEHRQVAKTLHALGRLAHSQYHYPEAEESYRRALQIQEQMEEPEDTEMARTLHALGWLFLDQGQYEAAYNYCRRAFLIRKRVLTLCHVGTATMLHQLGRIAQRQKHFPRAERLYRLALEIKKHVLVAEHPSIAITLDGLARVYQDEGRFQEAEGLYQEALLIREQQFGRQHQFTAELLQHLGGLYQDQGRFQEAERFLVEAFESRKRALGADHSITAITMHHLAQVYAAQERWEQAERLYVRVLAIREYTFGPTHRATRSVREGYRRVLYALQRDAEAAALQEGPN